jgi:hypothetical protein
MVTHLTHVVSVQEYVDDIADGCEHDTVRHVRGR